MSAGKTSRLLWVTCLKVRRGIHSGFKDRWLCIKNSSILSHFKVKSRKLKPIMQICPKCKQAIPTTKMAEHVRIELLDPKWKEQKAKTLEKSKETNLADNLTVFENLKQLAQARPDIFGGDELNLHNRVLIKFLMGITLGIRDIRNALFY